MTAACANAAIASRSARARHDKTQSAASAAKEIATTLHPANHERTEADDMTMNMIDDVLMTSETNTL